MRFIHGANVAVNPERVLRDRVERIVGHSWSLIVSVFEALPFLSDRKTFGAHIHWQICQLVESGIPRYQVRNVHHFHFFLQMILVSEVMIAVMTVHLPIATRMRHEEHRLLVLENAAAGDRP
jgi:hypothetical protein